jgi:predicted nucleic acid-binding protein
MMAASRLFIDTNVIVHSIIDQSALHRTAQQAILSYQRAGYEVWISRQILREFLATLSRPHGYTTGGRRISATRLIAEVRLLQTQYYIAEDSQDVTERLLKLLASINVGGKQIHDANIVATMLASGITHLLTENVSDFTRYSQLITIIPLV